MIRAGLLSIFLIPMVVARAEPSALYYAVESASSQPNDFELRLNYGNDFSNPYLQTHSTGLSGHWILHRNFGIGLEGTIYGSTKREAATTLASTLGPYGYQVLAPEPEWSSVAVIRFVPITGLVNLFSWKVIPIDLILLARAGVIRYSTFHPGLLVGAGLEVNIGIASNWGMVLAASWEDDHLPNSNRQSRVGFRAGPRVRF